MSTKHSQIINIQESSLFDVSRSLQTTTPFELEFVPSITEPHSIKLTFIECDEYGCKHSQSLTTMGDWAWPMFIEFCQSIKTDNGKFVGQFVKPEPSLGGAIRLFNVLNSQEVKARYDSELTPINSVTQVPSLSQPGLLVMDMDSTAIQIECIDEIAKLAGVGEEVAAVTASAMKGELDFSESLHARVATLKGAPMGIIEQVASDLPLMPGLKELVTVLQAHQWKIAIVSGGFTAMTEALKAQLNLDRTIANTLDVEDGKLAGTVSGKVIDAQAKADAVVALAREFGIPMSQTVAMGDGANDLVMMAKAQLGVAFHAKPLVREKADISVTVGGLHQLLYFLAP